MPLNGYLSSCEERQPIIVSRDVGTKREHRAINKNICRVTQYKVDGDVTRDTSIRCDYLVMNDDLKEAYLIELKGSDIEHALEQLEATAKRFQNELREYFVKYRIVCSRARTQAIYGSKCKKFKQKHSRSGEFVCRENLIEEQI